MVRLTADLILNSPSYFNPLKEREIQLRGNRIPAIENLGATQDQYDCIDLSDNEIAKLENFPQLNRLRTLFLNNNKISKVAPNMGENLPNLDTLILTNNQLHNLADLDALAHLPQLQRLSLLDNPVTKKQHYRLYTIHVLPHLRLLDFRKIKQKERQAAQRLFQSDQGKKLKEEIQAEAKNNTNVTTSHTKPAPSSAPVAVPSGFKSESQAIKDAVMSASSMDELVYLERTLAGGQVPASNKKKDEMEQ
mmetsp:Transcript_2421/g.3178  ORF Transcript_2421/g.3178 Transcript_2421/m.3178 type:complete len:249 (+) Transcript_2421:81-827(+)